MFDNISETIHNSFIERGNSADQNGVKKMTKSWIIKDAVTGAVLIETFSRKAVNRLDPKKFIAIPIGEYLAQLNRDLK